VRDFSEFQSSVPHSLFRASNFGTIMCWQALIYILLGLNIFIVSQGWLVCFDESVHVLMYQMQCMFHLQEAICALEHLHLKAVVAQDATCLFIQEEKLGNL